MKTKIQILEGYPEKIKSRLELRESKRRKSLPAYINGDRFELVMEDLKLWRVGTLKVSFRGGNSALHKLIADTASQWSEYANIKFDFGNYTGNSSFRSWKVNDTSHIRVGFDQEGYWSLVGTDSSDESIVPDGEISLNLQGFDQNLPSDWEGTVLHEFGHALGFHHEHQTPAFTCDFDWDKLYEYLAGPPNNWSRATVDHNLKQLPGGGLTYSPHDASSIMHYSFPDWMFVKGKESPCCTSRNNVLSPEDKTMASKAYPNAIEAHSRIDKRKKEHLAFTIKALGDAGNDVKSNFVKHFDFLEKDTEYKNFLKGFTIAESADSKSKIQS